MRNLTALPHSETEVICRRTERCKRVWSACQMNNESQIESSCTQMYQYGTKLELTGQAHTVNRTAHAHLPAAPKVHLDGVIAAVIFASFPKSESMLYQEPSELLEM